MYKRWVTKNNSASLEVVSKLAQSLNIDTVLSSLLTQRDITNMDEARRYFRPHLDHLHDPWLMQDMSKAIDRIESALHYEEKIMVYGDYDVDGITAVAMVYSFFRKYHSKVDFYIPSRYKEGYGISMQAIDFAKENGFHLLIALDCGIKAIDKAIYAKSKGIDLIIADHHLPEKEIPDAIAVLDPKRLDCSYPYKELSGCGIGFKLLQAFAQKKGLSFEEIKDYLDLVAVSIACDIVPITGENRTLAYWGLKKLNTHPSIGLKALMEVVSPKRQYTISDLVFLIGPRINAAGRMGDATNAVHLLIEPSISQARKRGADINLINTKRKECDLAITNDALNMLVNDVKAASRKTTVLYNEKWHKGVIGIVASRLIEHYYRPTIILTQSNNGCAVGSARSIAGYDLYGALYACKDLLLQFGGHRYAAGLTISLENVAMLQEKFEEVVAATITNDLLVPELNIDITLELCQITPKFFRILNQFAPFGPGNRKPLFVSKNVSINGDLYVVGAQHLKMSVVQGTSLAFDCIAFQQACYREQLQKGAPFDICYTIETNTCLEHSSIQLNVKGIRISKLNF